METTSQMSGNPASNPSRKDGQNPLKKWVILLAILSGIFFATTLYFGFFAKPVLNMEYNKVETANAELQQELDSLLDEHARIKARYGDLSNQLNEKDSIIMANAVEIEKLINSQADYNKIKRQLVRLQHISQEYVTEIDNLYKENKALKEENIQVKANLEQGRQDMEAMQKSNEDLTAKISNAAIYHAYNIQSYCLFTKSNGEQVRTEKASRAKEIRTELILGENSLIEAGPVTIYCRIAVPETGEILKMGTSDKYSFVHDGQRLQYSSKTTVNYNNEAKNVSLVWMLTPDVKATKGRYIVQIFTDEQYLGESYFTLR